MTMNKAPPTPIHLLRPHSSRINTLWFSDDNERLYSGDTSGMVIITSTRTLRSIASWKAHNEGLLGVQEWNDSVLTYVLIYPLNSYLPFTQDSHGRDNKLHVWTLVRETTARVREAASQPGLPTPSLQYSMDVNALNYCRFSLMPLPSLQNEEQSALIALPNLIESSLVSSTTSSFYLTMFWLACIRRTSGSCPLRSDYMQPLEKTARRICHL